MKVVLTSPRQKIVAKRGATFTIMLVGETGLGKTTFINTLFSTAVKGHTNNMKRHTRSLHKTPDIGLTKAVLEERGFKVKLNIFDTLGFGDNVNNKEAWQPIVDFLDDQHESYFRQEQQPSRRDINDMRVHVCLYFMRPTGHSLRPLDIETMKQLCTRVNLIPVIAKADTLSQQEISDFKFRIRQVLEAQGISIYKPIVDKPGALDTSEIHSTTPAEAAQIQSLVESMPFSVIGSEDDVETNDGRIVKGRKYIWGVAEVENDQHCDFRKLRQLLVGSHMLDLIHSTQDVHYEAYRANQMETRKFGEARAHTFNNPKFKEEENRLRKLFIEQVQAEEQRFRQWEQNLIAERDRLNKDLETTHAAIRQLESEVENLSLKK